jgi:hypothetical protein
MEVRSRRFGNTGLNSHAENCDDAFRFVPRPG